MLTTATINVHELLQVADAVAREKSVDQDIVISALEDAIAKFAKLRYGTEYDIRVFINRSNAEIDIFRFRKVVEDVEDAGLEISLDEAHIYNTSLKIDDFFEEPLPPVEIGRISAQSARQVIIQRIRDADRQRQYDEFIDRVGEIIHGTVKRVEFGNVFLDLGGRGEGIIRRVETLPRENFKVGDRVRAYLYEVRRDNSGSQIFLSRTHPQFMVKLFSIEVPEIYDNVIKIMAVARDPGSRAKIAVYTNDTTLDVVGACVGLRGSRVQAVTNELQGEKIDIIPWSENQTDFLVSAVAPTEILRIVIDDENKKMDVVVPDGALSQLIGRKGQNIKLLSQLLGWNIAISTETEDAEKRQREFVERTKLFMEVLDVDEFLSQLLVSEGFTSIEDIAFSDVDEFTSIEGFDQEIASELKMRAAHYLEEKKIKTLENANFDQRIKDIKPLDIEMMLTLSKNKINTIEDLAGLVPDDLFIDKTDLPEDEIAGEMEDDNQEESSQKGENKAGEEEGILQKYDLSSAIASDIIMTARQKAGWIKESSG